MTSPTSNEPLSYDTRGRDVLDRLDALEHDGKCRLALWFSIGAFGFSMLAAVGVLLMMYYGHLVRP